MTTTRVVGECFFWYRLTRVFPDKFHRAVKRLCCVCVCVLSVARDADAAVETRISVGWNKFRKLVPLLTNKDISLLVRRRLYSSSVPSSMLHRSETWPIGKENVVALQWEEIKMVRWMHGMKLQDRVPSKGLRERLGLDDIILILQQNRLRWYGHMLRKEDNDWLKKCNYGL